MAFSTLQDIQTGKIYIFYGSEQYLFQHDCNNSEKLLQLNKHNLHLSDNELINKSILIAMNEPFLLININNQLYHNEFSSHDYLSTKKEMFVKYLRVKFYGMPIIKQEWIWYNRRRFCEGICIYCGAKVSEKLYVYLR